MKDYIFMYDKNKEEIIKCILKNTNNAMNAFFSNDIYCRVKTDYIRLKKKKQLQHPLQRIFIGKVYEIQSKTIIIGKFKYPYFFSLCFILIMFVFISGNISLLISNTNSIKKLLGSAFFTLFDMMIITLFVSGKKCFKKQEKNIIYFLENLLTNERC